MAFFSDALLDKAARERIGALKAGVEFVLSDLLGSKFGHPDLWRPRPGGGVRPKPELQALGKAFFKNISGSAEIEAIKDTKPQKYRKR